MPIKIVELLFMLLMLFPEGSWEQFIYFILIVIILAPGLNYNYRIISVLLILMYFAMIGLGIIRRMI